ncbi:MAG TPA: GDSL-type esterase/lipase family protein [Anaerohalosphaeraceae bacterium]|nr:GDSL-type esterase/lipase family protein [Anaerohalosphaeraceae bacterium]HOL89815.1 GDSL-type esterase/lipase family protein [Anaerohalosphaeraceae bacterium]HPP56500.1 GDSL-type esterase/lipase family protein [Anaerohalosphaeraceae bacterium]
MKWLTAIFGVTAAVSLAVNVVCLRILIRQYVLLRLDRSRTFCKLEPEIREDRPSILFLGDSRIAQWNPLPVFEGMDILNLGCSGATSADLLQQVFRMRYPSQTRLAVIGVGINDMTVIGICPEKKEEVLAQCRKNFKEMIRCLQERRIAVLLLPILPPGKIGWFREFFWSKEADIAIRRMNEELAHLAENGAAAVLNCSELMDENGRLKACYVKDMLHWNTAAYQILNSAVKSEAVRLLGRSEP